MLACSNVMADPRIDVSGVRRVVRDRFQERVLHVVERSELLGSLALAPERLRVLPFGRLERLFRLLAFRDVDHESPELLRPP
jgi:hypothetical protein